MVHGLRRRSLSGARPGSSQGGCLSRSCSLRRPVTKDGAERLNRSAKIHPERSFMRRTRATDAHREVQKTDAEWQQALTGQQYEVLRRAATEPPFTGEYVLNKADGSYRCGACGATLFDSATKFESGTGWPSFTEPAGAAAAELRPHHSLVMR